MHTQASYNQLLTAHYLQMFLSRFRAICCMLRHSNLHSLEFTMNLAKKYIVEAKG